MTSVKIRWSQGDSSESRAKISDKNENRKGKETQMFNPGGLESDWMEFQGARLEKMERKQLFFKNRRFLSADQRHGVLIDKPWIGSSIIFTKWNIWYCLSQDQKKAMVTHSSVLAWRIPGMEGPGRLQDPMGSHRVGHDWSDLAAAASQDHSLLFLIRSSLVFFTVKARTVKNNFFCRFPGWGCPHTQFCL